MNTRKLKYTSLSVRVWVPWLEIVKIAADKKKISVPDYVRERLGPVAAKDAGIPFPGFPKFGPRGRPSTKSDVEAAAEKLGVSVQMFQRMAIETVAKQALLADRTVLERTLASSLEDAAAKELEDPYPSDERSQSEMVRKAGVR